jgi:hypothetical protein
MSGRQETPERQKNLTAQEERVERAKRLAEKAEQNRREAQQRASEEDQQQLQRQRNRAAFKKSQSTSNQAPATKDSEKLNGGSSVGSAKGTSAVTPRRAGFGSSASRPCSARSNR